MDATRPAERSADEPTDLYPILPEPIIPEPILDVQDERLEADHSKVVLRPFNLGWQQAAIPSERARDLVRDIRRLTEDEVERELAHVLRDFKSRHWQIEAVFEERFAELGHAFNIEPADISRARRLLIAAFFSHEYTYAAAALMNPSIVPHPDQSGATGGAIRIVMSVRAVGEGHISSIGFREGFLEKDGLLTLWPDGDFAIAASPDATDGPDIIATRNAEASLSNTVLFPMTPQQQGGLEDLRLVQFVHEDGTPEWIGTYTAYSGDSIRSELLRTRDFASFRFTPIRGDAGRDKGMALFPRKVGGRYLMVGRQDGKNLYLLASDRLTRWQDDGVKLLTPEYPWEFVQIGNCGSPIETEEGWLLLTHGVGAMRRYSLGCALLDLEDPSRVIARSARPILTAEQEDRNGYVPNVVYSCGGMLSRGGVLFVPYGISDSAIGFGSVPLERLLDSLERV
ncbi:glycoside hydrolase family 130 protein [Erythrobacter sp.]|uniref:glycoside hydrolase family 130 protein n=1 Tax=Erythrobacter sp. TaxID=1042 RepID=UPI002E9DB4FA|nr:glycoside hydrolase family 130 protein [Erythrobacter sp.]